MVYKKNIKSFRGICQNELNIKSQDACKISTRRVSWEYEKHKQERLLTFSILKTFSWTWYWRREGKKLVKSEIQEQISVIPSECIIYKEFSISAFVFPLKSILSCWKRITLHQSLMPAESLWKFPLVLLLWGFLYADGEGPEIKRRLKGCLF